MGGVISIREKSIIYQNEKGCHEMNNESIAKLVHDLVKNPKNVLSQEHGLSWGELNTNELTIIQRVFSRLEVSGDVLTFEIIPLDFW